MLLCPLFGPKNPDRRDPAFRRLGDRINFAFNAAMYAFMMSGAWFIRLLRSEIWTWTIWLTWIWLAVLLFQGLYVFVIADYSDATNPSVELSDTKDSQIDG